MQIFIATTSVFIIAVATFFEWRRKRLQQIRIQLQKPLKGLPAEHEDQWGKNRIWEFTKGNSVVLATGAFTTAQAIFHLNKIDDQALEVIDKIYSPGVENSLEEIANHILELGGRSSAALEGGKSLYKGHLGEVKFAEHLAAKGHHVELAKSPNQPGWDALVDGQKVNFKAGTDPSHIQQHLNEYPEIPVFTISEQQGNFDSDERVTCFSDLSGEEIEHVTEATMEGIVGATSLCEGMPFALAFFSTVKNFKPVIQGKCDVKFAAKNTVVETASVGGLMFLGGCIGGATLGPFGALAGSLVCGLVGRRFSKTYTEKELNIAIDKVNESLSAYAEAFLLGLRTKADSLRESSKEIRPPFSWKRLVLPSPSDLIRREISEAYSCWANRCVLRFDELHAKMETKNGGKETGLQLLNNGDEEIVYAPTIVSAKNNVVAANKQFDIEAKRLGY